PKRLLKIQQDLLAGPSRPPHLVANLGVACYRAEKYEEAIKHLTETEKQLGHPDPLSVSGKPSTPVREGLFLAMAYHKAGQPREAKEAYERAAKEMDATRRVALDWMFMPSQSNWQERLQLVTLRKETEQTLGIVKP